MFVKAVPCGTSLHRTSQAVTKQPSFNKAPVLSRPQHPCNTRATLWRTNVAQARGGSSNTSETTAWDIPPEMACPVDLSSAGAHLSSESEDESSGKSGLFTDQFKAILAQALERSQAQMDAYGNSDDETAPVEAYVPAPPPAKAMGPLEEVLDAALKTSQTNLRRLNAMKTEIETAIQRETVQLERLDFAMQKAGNDAAYYQNLEKSLSERTAQIN